MIVRSPATVTVEMEVRHPRPDGTLGPPIKVKVTQDVDAEGNPVGTAREERSDG